jgi:hypothetical protein
MSGNTGVVFKRRTSAILAFQPAWRLNRRMISGHFS